jgi:hypothetical protein
MNDATTTFDATAGEQAKQLGMLYAAIARPALLEIAREGARDIAQRRGTVTADDVQAYLMELGYIPADLGNAAGSIFKGREWEFTGQWVGSARVSRHRNSLRVWRLRANR